MARVPVQPWDPRWVAPFGAPRGKKVFLLARDPADAQSWWAVGKDRTGNEEFGVLSLRRWQIVKNAPDPEVLGQEGYEDFPEPSPTEKDAIMQRLERHRAGRADQAGG
jgi:hypothetical protein